MVFFSESRYRAQANSTTQTFDLNNSYIDFVFFKLSVPDFDFDTVICFPKTAQNSPQRISNLRLKIIILDGFVE